MGTILSFKSSGIKPHPCGDPAPPLMGNRVLSRRWWSDQLGDGGWEIVLGEV